MWWRMLVKTDTILSMKKIELNVSLERNYDGMPVPSGPEEYPSFSFTEDEPCDLPEEGTLTVKYRLARHEEDKTNEERPKYRYTVQIEKLISAVPEEEESKPSYKESEDALDALAAEKAKEKSEY